MLQRLAGSTEKGQRIGRKVDYNDHLDIPTALAHRFEQFSRRLDIVGVRGRPRGENRTVAIVNGDFVMRQ